jgi:hypothetical protein
MLHAWWRELVPGENWSLANTPVYLAIVVLVQTVECLIYRGVVPEQ